MAEIDFNAMFNSLKSGVKQIAEQNINEYVENAVTDGTGILQDLENQLKTWAEQLATGTLSKDDFEYNLLSEKDLMVMVGLKQVGLAQIEVDKFKNAVFNLITQTLETVIP